MKQAFSALLVLLLAAPTALAQNDVDALAGTWVALQSRVFASEGDTLAVPTAQVLVLALDDDALRGTQCILMGEADWEEGEANARGTMGFESPVEGLAGGVDGALVRARVAFLPGPAGGKRREFDVTVLPSGDRLRLTPAFESAYGPLEMWRVPQLD